MAIEHGVQEAVRRAANTSNVFGKIHKRQILRWKRALASDKKKPGNKGTPEAFNAAVLANLIYTSVEDAESPGKVDVIANVAYSIANIVMAATMVQRSVAFENDKHVQALKFSHPLSHLTRWKRNHAAAQGLDGYNQGLHVD